AARSSFPRGRRGGRGSRRCEKCRTVPTPARRSDGETGTDVPPLGGGGALLAATLEPALLANALQHALAPKRFEARMQDLDLAEDLLGDRHLLIARGDLDALPADRIAELDRDLRELPPAPVAHLGGAVDRDRHDRPAGLQRA